MDSSNNLKKILKLLSNEMSYNMLNLATQQCFTLAANSPAPSFVKILDYYKGLLFTKTESTRTILPAIMIPQLIKFYNRYKDEINEHIMLQRQRLIDLRAREESQDITGIPEPKSVKAKKRVAKSKNKESEEADDHDDGESIGISKTNRKKTEGSHNGVKQTDEQSSSSVNEEIKREQEDEISQLAVYEYLCHNLNSDSTLFQIDDFDLNYIVCQCKPLVLSTQDQLDAENEKELDDMKHGKNTGGKKSKNKKFESLSTIDNLRSLQSKTLSVQAMLDSSCKRSIKEFLKHEEGKNNKRKKVIGSRRSNRVNTEIQVDKDIVDNVYFDPIISLFLYFRHNMLNEIWTVRQYC